MMFTPDEMIEATGGRWLGPPPEQGPVCIGHDTRQPLDGGAYVAIRGDARDGHDYLPEAARAGATMAIVEQPVESDLPCLLVDGSVDAIARLASRWRDSIGATKVIAITGTAGKTSTKNLLNTILGSHLEGTASPASWNNSIGGPMSLLRARPGDDYVVLEAGTSSPGEIESLARIIRPDIAIITLIGRGHLEGLSTIDGVRREKTSLLAHVASGGMAIVHDDEQAVRVPESVSLLRHGDLPGSDPGLASRSDGRIVLHDGSSFRFPIPGKHHAINALAVIAASRACGLDDAQIDSALSHAMPSDGRGACTTHGGVIFINDAYNANPESVHASLSMLPEMETNGRRVVILGDMLELGDHSAQLHLELESRLVQTHSTASIAQLVLLGKEMAQLRKSLASGHLPQVSHWETLDQKAIEQIANLLIPGDLVLLKGSRGMQLERIPEYLDSMESEAARA
tara:strand:- start:17613 stop:18980 length:1368 start_codon:yes stop_codon:yes gene_type:complete